jgi:hypothetical protein
MTRAAPDPSAVPLPADEGAALALLRGPLAAALSELTGAVTGVERLGELAYRASAERGEFVVRFAQDEAGLAGLEKEARVQRGLRERVTARLPDTRVFRGGPGFPPLAIHRLVPGQPLTTELLEGMSPPALDRLARDLVQFFAETHAVPLGLAADWLGLPPGEARAPEALAKAVGKPAWFTPCDTREIRRRLEPALAPGELALFDRTAAEMAALPVDPGWLVFGHGDLHGFNMAITWDALGAKFSGAFDLGCAGILDLHEDFFRLSLVSEALLERVLAAYQERTEGQRSIERGRLALYYRAFLFYLMAEFPPGSGRQEHLRRMLEEHLDYFTR